MSAADRTGERRALLLPAVLLFLFLPLILFARTASVRGQGIIPLGSLDAAFGRSLIASAALGGETALLTLIAGTLTGILLGCGDFRGRGALRVLWRTMLVCSPVIPAGGWLLFLAGRTDSLGQALRGPFGAALASAAMFTPIVALAVETALASQGRGAAEAALQSGGRGRFFRWALGASWPAAITGAMIAGTLAIGDATAGEMFGVRGAAGEVLVSLAARYDFGEAAGQCLVLSSISALMIACVLRPAAKGIATASLAMDSGPRPIRVRPNPAMIAGLWLMTAALVLPPLWGIVTGATRNAPWGRALDTLQRTGPATIFLAGGGAVLALLFGALVAGLVGREKSRILAVAPVAVAVLVLPPAAGAFGVRALTDLMPDAIAAALDQGGASVLAAAFRFWPIAFIFIVRARAAEPPSRAEAAAVAAVSNLRFGMRVTWRALAGSVATAGVIILLLGSSDVTTALLIGPAGRPTTMQAIYTTVANAREAHAAALFSAWLGAALVVFCILEWVAAKTARTAGK